MCFERAVSNNPYAYAAFFHEKLSENSAVVSLAQLCLETQLREFKLYAA